MKLIMNVSAFRHRYFPENFLDFTVPGSFGIRDPLISIIIPNKDHIDDLKRCMNAIDSKSTYKNYEYVIVENNSTDPATFQYYKDLEKENPKARVVYWDGPFNYLSDQ